MSAPARRPRLAIVRLDARGPSAVYAASVWRAARSVGVDAFEIAPPEGVALSDLAARIGALNRDPSIAGIVIAQPVPSHLDASDVVELIDPAKDVDGATPLNAGKIARGERTFVPATALAVMAILRSYGIPIAGKRAVVVGRSAVVGRPAAALLLAADATVQITHRRTRNLARETRRAEILVVAAGVPHLIRAEMVNRSAVVIDCGINTTPDGIVGDVDYAAVRPVVERHHARARRRRTGHDHDAAAADGRRRRTRRVVRRARAGPIRPPRARAAATKSEPGDRGNPSSTPDSRRCAEAWSIISSSGTEPSMKPRLRIVS